MKRKAIIDPITGLVENVIVVADDNFTIEGKELVEVVKDFGIGDSYRGKKFTKRPSE